MNIVIIEDQKETREMLAALINSHEQYECISAFENAEDAVAAIPELRPDVVLVDIHLPGKSGIYCVSKLKPLLPATQFIMCTSLENNESIFDALKSGACGYLSKSTSPQKILEAIQDAFNGGSPMSCNIARKVVGSFQHNNEIEKLSQREVEILDHLAKGYRYKEISGILHISIETVRKHIHNIYEKLQVNSRTDALNKLNYRKN